MPPQLHDHIRAIYQELGSALASWAAVEHALAGLYVRCANFDNPKPALHGFWAIVSFEAKLKMSHATISSDLEAQPELLTQWGTNFNRLTRKNKKRNKIAHGTVRTTMMKDKFGKQIQDTYFSPYGFKALDTFKPDQEIIKGKTHIDFRPKDRLYVRDIAQIAQSFDEVKIRLWELSDEILRRKMQQAHHERQALEREILERHGLQANPTQPETPPPPEPSQE